MLTVRSEQQAREAAVPPGTDNQEIGADRSSIYGKEAAESAIQVSLAALGKSPEKNIKRRTWRP